MAMHNKGLTKAMEECGEFVQIAAKKSAYMDAEFHPDGSNLNLRLEEEIGDVFASARFVMIKLGLNQERILERARMKDKLYLEWDNE